MPTVVVHVVIAATRQQVKPEDGTKKYHYSVFTGIELLNFRQLGCINGAYIKYFKTCRCHYSKLTHHVYAPGVVEYHHLNKSMLGGAPFYNNYGYGYQ